jgi:hypothetical protein
MSTEVGGVAIALLALLLPVALNGLESARRGVADGVSGRTEPSVEPARLPPVIQARTLACPGDSDEPLFREFTDSAGGFPRLSDRQERVGTP